MRRLSPAGSSLISVVVGWLFFVPAFAHHFAVADGNGLGLELYLVTFPAAVFLFGVWMFWLAPVHVIVPSNSRFWHPLIFIPCCSLVVPIFYCAVMISLSTVISPKLATDDVLAGPADLLRDAPLSILAATGALIGVLELVVKAPKPHLSKHRTMHGYDY